MTEASGDPSRLLQQAARLFESGERRAAGESAREVLRALPEQPDALHILGLIAVGEGRVTEGVELLRRAVVVRPDHAFTLNSLGDALRQAERPAEAVPILRRALVLKPDFAEAHSNLSNALVNLGQSVEAEAACRRALALEPDFVEASANLGNALAAQGRIAEAVEAFRRAIALAPRLAGAHTNLGNALGHLGRHDEAERAHRRAIELNPDLAEAHLNLGCCLLAQGKLAAGWVEHEWRWRARSHRFPWRHGQLPRWQGQPQADGALLLWGEQGIGDELLHAGIVDAARASAPRLVLECAPRLVPLFMRSLPGFEVVPRLDPPHPRAQAADIAGHAPTGSLGQWFRRGGGKFPRRASYLIADPARAAGLRERYRRLDGGPVVGISWRSQNTRFGAAKTLGLDAWAPVLRVPGITFVDLQYGDTAAEREALRHALGVSVHHDAEIDSFADLDAFAAQVAAMDLVITVSNTAAHMTGALGRPGWVLLPAGPGLLWYWHFDRADSPWYPSLRLFRQPRPGDWAPVIERIADQLRSFAGGGVPPT